MAGTPDVTVVIPAHNAGPFLGRVLSALQEAVSEGRVVVVDAGSTDDTGELARSLGAQLVSLPEKVGPARARNAGVAETNAEIVLFVDADCVPHADVIDRVREAFRTDPALVSLTGSYDTAPPEQSFFSQYMNLRHHFVHQQAQKDNATFWAGCGAVRRQVFLEIGGFDEARFPRPQIEDIELGVRLRRIGRTCLDPDLQVTHLKRWTLRSVVETDIRHRGIPWARLILETGELPNDLNLRWAQRVAAVLAPLALAAIFVVPWAAWTGRWVIVGLCALVLVASVALSRRMLAFFAGARGFAFAAGAWLFHQVHLLYSGMTIVFSTLWHLARDRARSQA